MFLAYTFPLSTKKKVLNLDPGQVQFQKAHLSQGLGEALWGLPGSGEGCFVLQEYNPAVNEPKVRGCQGFIHPCLRTHLDPI